MTSDHAEPTVVAFDAASPRQLTGCRVTSGHGEHPVDGVGVGRIAVELDPMAHRPGSEHPWGSREFVDIGRIDRGGEFVEELLVRAQEVGGAVEEHGDIALCDVVEHGKYLVADAIPAKAGVVVAGVVCNRKAEVVAHRSRLEASEREDRVAPSGSDRSEAGGTRAAQQRQEQGFGLVVGGVTGQGVGADRRPAGGAGARFEVGAVVDVDRDRVELDAEGCGGGPGDVGIDVCRCSKAVVDVDRGDVAAGGDGQRNERRRVGATGESTGDRCAVRREGAPAEQVGEVNQRCSPRVVDRYRWV